MGGICRKTITRLWSFRIWPTKIPWDFQCPSHQPLRSNSIGSYWLRRFCSGLWDHFHRVIFSRAFLFSTILLCKNVWRKDETCSGENLKTHRCKELAARPFRDLYSLHIKISYYRAGTLATVSLATLWEPIGLPSPETHLFKVIRCDCRLNGYSCSLDASKISRLAMFCSKPKCCLQYQTDSLGLKPSHTLWQLF